SVGDGRVRSRLGGGCWSRSSREGLQMRPLPSPTARSCGYRQREAERMRVVKIDQGTAQTPDPQFQVDQVQLEHPMVLVIWRDAFFDFDQADPDDIRPDYLVHTVGFLLAQGPKFVSLAQEVLPDG